MNWLLTPPSPLNFRPHPYLNQSKPVVGVTPDYKLSRFIECMQISIRSIHDPHVDQFTPLRLPDFPFDIRVLSFINYSEVTELHIRLMQYNPGRWSWLTGQWLNPLLRVKPRFQMCRFNPLPSLQMFHTIPPAATCEDVNRQSNRVNTGSNCVFLIASLHTRDTNTLLTMSWWWVRSRWLRVCWEIFIHMFLLLIIFVALGCFFASV